MATVIVPGTKVWGQTFFQEGKFVALRQIFFGYKYMIF